MREFFPPELLKAFEEYTKQNISDELLGILAEGYYRKTTKNDCLVATSSNEGVLNISCKGVFCNICPFNVITIKPHLNKNPEISNIYSILLT